MKLEALRTFVAVADALSFSAAAGRRHRSQPAVSRQITALEQSLGAKLLDRGTRHVALTGAGRELLDRARELLREADGIAARMRSLATGEVGTLRVGTTPVSLDFMAPLLGAFAAKWKNVDLVVAQDSATGLFSQVEAGALDVVVSRYATTDTLRCQRWFPTYVVALVHAAHGLARRNGIDLRELEREPLLLANRDSGSRILVEHACQLDGLRLRRVLIESPVIRGVAAMAEARLGIAVVLSSVNLVGLDVVRIPLFFRGAPMGTWAGAIWARARELPDYALDFIHMGAAMTRRQYPGHELRAPPLPKPAQDR